MNDIIQSGIFDQEVIDLIYTMEYHGPTNQWYILTRWTDKVDFDFELLQKYFDIIEHEAEILKGPASFISMIPKKPTGRTRIRAHFIDSAVGLMVFEKFYRPGFTVQTKSDGLSLMPAANIKPMTQPALLGEVSHEVIVPRGRVYPKYEFGSNQHANVDLKLQETADYYNKRMEQAFFNPQKPVIDMAVNMKEFSNAVSSVLRSAEAFRDTFKNHSRLEASTGEQHTAPQLPELPE